MILYLFTILLLCSQVVVSVFNPTHKKNNMPVGVRQLEYSPDQKILAVSNDVSTSIYDGVTSAFIQKFDYPQGLTFTSFSFSQDQNKFAVGYKNQQGTVVYSVYTRNTDSQQGVSDSARYSVQHHNIGLIGHTTALCFTADNKYLVVGSSSGDIIVWKSNDELHAIKFNDSIPVSTVSCSHERTLQFVVGGGSQEQARLATYTFNPQTLQIMEQHNFQLNQPNSTIHSVRYAVDASQIYYCGSGNIISAVQVDQPYTIRQIVTGFNNFVKIRTTAKDDIVVACNADTLYINKNKPTSTSTSTTTQILQQQQVKSINQPTFALGQHGSNIAYMLSNNNMQVAGQCVQGYYLDDRTDICLACYNLCTLCLDSPTVCFGCVQAHYLSSSNQCLKCLPHCRSCSTGLTCDTCYDPFVLVDHALCGCEKGKYVNDLTCSACPQGCLSCVTDKLCTQCADDYQKDQEGGLCLYQGGLPTWVIVLLIILGVAIVVIITGIVVLKMRKGQKRSPLLTDSDQGQKQRVTTE